MKKILYLLKLIIYSLTKNTNKKVNLRVEYLRDNGAKIGNDTRIFSELVGSEPYLIEINDEVVVSTNVHFITHDNSIGMYLGDKATDVFGKIKIGKHSFIGANSTILPGVELGENTIVGAGSIVTKSFKEGNIVIAGNPAKIITSVDQYVRKNKNKAINVSGLSYFEKKDKILIEEKDKLLLK